MSQHTQIGIEFTDTVIRMVLATRQGTTWKIEKRVRQALPAGVILQGDLKNMEHCIDALKQGLASLKSTAPAVICIPSAVKTGGGALIRGAAQVIGQKIADD